jgi:hypothetical protein
MPLEFRHRLNRLRVLLHQCTVTAPMMRNWSLLLQGTSRISIGARAVLGEWAGGNSTRGRATPSAVWLVRTQPLAESDPSRRSLGEV